MILVSQTAVYYCSKSIKLCARNEPRNLESKPDASMLCQNAMTMYFKTRKPRLFNSTLGRTRKFMPPPLYKWGGVDGALPWSFRYVAVF